VIGLSLGKHVAPHLPQPRPGSGRDPIASKTPRGASLGSTVQEAYQPRYPDIGGASSGTGNSGDLGLDGQQTWLYRLRHAGRNPRTPRTLIRTASPVGGFSATGGSEGGPSRGFAAPCLSPPAPWAAGSWNKGRDREGGVDDDSPEHVGRAQLVYR
jgi:hypothetical protein